MCLYNKHKYSSFLFIARHFSVVWVAPQLSQPFTCCHFDLHVCARLWRPEVSSSVLPYPHPFAHWFSKPSWPASPRHPPVCICPWARRFKKHQPTSLLHECWGAALGLLCLQSKHFRDWAISWNTVLAIIFLQKNKVPWSLVERGKNGVAFLPMWHFTK